MSAFQVNGQEINKEEISEMLVAGISQTLDDAGVPSILWKEFLINLYGVPSIVWSVDFVLPDDKISTGYEALRAVGFHECKEYGECPFDADKYQSWPVPAQHLHINEEDTLSLYKKSATLPDLSSFEVDPSNGELMFASEKLLPHTKSGFGCLPTPIWARCHPVRIPTPAYYYKAVHELYRQNSVWVVMINYMELYVRGSDILDVPKIRRGHYNPRPVTRLSVASSLSRK